MSSFENKVVIITGCSSGIGLATTRILLDRGARVFDIDISPFSQEAGSNETFTFHQVDLTKPNAADEAVAAGIQKCGPKIDVLANVAGVMDAFGSVDTVKESEWERVLSINLSAGAIDGSGAPNKHGLVGATKNVAWRFHNEGIRCNAVLPGGVATNIQSSIQRENWDMPAYMASSGVIGLHTPSDAQGVPQVDIAAEDVANAIVFLASDEAKKVNGVLMPVDNAWSTI
ncbi:hypothetical protein E8E11_011144 [Didymella keratinophila]|nr:hypothetical protein E8E11_011144 [Didymella keratinophila]